MSGYIDEQGIEWGIGAEQALPEAGSYAADAIRAKLCGEHDDLTGAELYSVVRYQADGVELTNTDPVIVLWWPAENIGAVLDNAQCYWAARRTPADVLTAYLRGEDYEGGGLSR